METRKIIVVSTKNQKKSVIMSAATTLAELKFDLKQNNIDYDGMTFYEGTSKTELKTDESVLPHDVLYKGTTTNELVFMLTNTNKKIRSGAMSRKEAYDAIKANNLQAECVKKFGKNFTMCKTADLISLVENAGKKAVLTSAPKAEKPVPTPVKEEKVEEAPACADAPTPETPTEVVDTKARAAISRLTEILYDADHIDCCEREEILNILGGKVVIAVASPEEDKASESPYSDAEIDSMFGFVK